MRGLRHVRRVRNSVEGGIKRGPHRKGLLGLAPRRRPARAPYDAVQRRWADALHLRRGYVGVAHGLSGRRVKARVCGSAVCTIELTHKDCTFFVDVVYQRHHRRPNAPHQHHHPPPRRPPRRPARRLAPTRRPRSNDDDDGPHGPTADHHLFRSYTRHTAVDPPPTRRHAPPPARARCCRRWQQRPSRRRARDRHGGAYGRGRGWCGADDTDAHRRWSGATRWAEGAYTAAGAWRVWDAAWGWAGAAVGGVGAAGGGVGWEGVIEWLVGYISPSGVNVALLTPRSRVLMTLANGPLGGEGTFFINGENGVFLLNC